MSFTKGSGKTGCKTVKVPHTTKTIQLSTRENGKMASITEKERATQTKGNLSTTANGKKANFTVKEKNISPMAIFCAKEIGKMISGKVEVNGFT
jgi:hypothetical protein